MRPFKHVRVKITRFASFERWSHWQDPPQWVCIQIELKSLMESLASAIFHLQICIEVLHTIWNGTPFDPACWSVDHLINWLAIELAFRIGRRTGVQVVTCNAFRVVSDTHRVHNSPSLPPPPSTIGLGPALFEMANRKCQNALEETLLRIPKATEWLA